MSQEERFGTRDRTYSAWHRRYSTQRFIGIEHAQLLAMIDLDASLYVEYDDGTKEPLALIETARDHGQPVKPSTVTQKLAILADLPAFVVLYTLAPIHNPADPHWPDVAAFRIKRLWPQPSHEYRSCTPQRWAEDLLALRKFSARQIDQGLRKKLDPLSQLHTWWESTPQRDREKFAEYVQEWMDGQRAAWTLDEHEGTQP